MNDSAFRCCQARFRSRDEIEGDVDDVKGPTPGQRVHGEVVVFVEAGEGVWRLIRIGRAEGTPGSAAVGTSREVKSC